MTNKPLVKNIFSLSSVQLLNYIFPLLTVPIISRVIGPDKFGVINFISAIIMYFTLLIGYGFDLTATRKITQNLNDQAYINKVFNEVFTSQFLLLGLSLILFSVLFFFVPQLQAEKLVAIFSFLTCFSTLFTQNWLFQAKQELSKVAMLNLTSKVIFSILIVLIITDKKDYIWQPLALSVSQIVIAIASFFWSIQRYNLKLKLVPLSVAINLILSERIIFFSMIVINLYTTTTVVLLGFFQNSTEVGYYTAAQRLISIISAVVALPLAQALYPFLGKAFSESREKGIDLAQKTLALVFYLTAFAGIFLWFVGPYMLKLFYGEAFSPSVAVFQVLAFIPMIVALSNVLGIHIMLNLKMDKLFFKVTALGALIGLFLNIILINPLGYIASAYILLFTELTILLIMHHLLKRQGIQAVNIKYFYPSYIGKSLPFIRNHL